MPGAAVYRLRLQSRKALAERQKDAAADTTSLPAEHSWS